MAFFVPALIAAGSSILTLFVTTADDAAETITGERGGIPYLQIIIILGAIYFIWKFSNKGGG